MWQLYLFILWQLSAATKMWQLWHFHERQFSRRKIVPTFFFLQLLCLWWEPGGEMGRWGGGEDNVLFWDAAQQWSWDADGEGQIRKQENASISLLLFLIPIGHHAVSFFKFQNESILPKIFFVKLWCNVLPPNCQPLPIRSWTSFPEMTSNTWTSVQCGYQGGPLGRNVTWH